MRTQLKPSSFGLTLWPWGSGSGPGLQGLGEFALWLISELPGEVTRLSLWFAHVLSGSYLSCR